MRLKRSRDQVSVSPRDEASANRQAAGSQVAEILTDNKEGYLDLVENSENLVISLTPGGLIYYINPKWLERLQMNEAEAKDLPFVEIVHPSDRERCALAIENVTANNTSEFITCDLKTKDGKVIRVEGNMSCYYKDDELVAIRGFFSAKATKPVRDNLSGVALERIFLEFHDVECSLAEPCFDED